MQINLPAGRSVSNGPFWLGEFPRIKSADQSGV
jgi:hypothetical protein